MKFFICSLLYFEIFLSTMIIAQDPQTSNTQSNMNKIWEGFKGLWRDFTEQFANKYKSVQDFSVTNKQELLSKINDTQNYLALVVKHKQEILRQATNETKQSAQAALDNVNGWFNNVASFQTRVIQSTDAQFSQLKQEWLQSMAQFWNQGLNRIVDLGKNLQIQNDGK